MLNKRSVQLNNTAFETADVLTPINGEKGKSRRTGAFSAYRVRLPALRIGVGLPRPLVICADKLIQGIILITCGICAVCYTEYVAYIIVGITVGSGRG